MSNPTEKAKDRRVLSVPAGITHAHMTEHNVYSCPENYPLHDTGVDAFAPRNEEGRIPRLYCIITRIVTDPRNPVFPPNLKPDYAQSIAAYIRAVSHLKGMLDNGGSYRFYILSDLENGALKHSPSINPPGPSHVYLSLKDLISGSPVVSPAK